jgi:hypothetical protein
MGRAEFSRWMAAENQTIHHTNSTRIGSRENLLESGRVCISRDFDRNKNGVTRHIGATNHWASKRARTHVTPSLGLCIAATKDGVLLESLIDSAHTASQRNPHGRIRSTTLDPDWIAENLTLCLHRLRYLLWHVGVVGTIIYADDGNH